MTPLIRERIKLLRDAVAAADFFFVDELAPYDPAELIPAKRRSRAMPRWPGACLQNAQEVLATTTFDHDSLDQALARGRRFARSEGRAHVSAHPGRRLRTQERAAAV